MTTSPVLNVREQHVLHSLDRHYGCAPWERAYDLDTSSEIAYRSSPCNPFDCGHRSHQFSDMPIPRRHVVRFTIR